MAARMPAATAGAARFMRVSCAVSSCMRRRESARSLHKFAAKFGRATHPHRTPPLRDIPATFSFSLRQCCGGTLAGRLESEHNTPARSTADASQHQPNQRRNDATEFQRPERRRRRPRLRDEQRASLELHGVHVNDRVDLPRGDQARTVHVQQHAVAVEAHNTLRGVKVGPRGCLEAPPRASMGRHGARNRFVAPAGREV